MTNKEKYKQAFSALHTSQKLSLEVTEMEKAGKRLRFRTMAASVAACALIIGGPTAAYAADVGGIQRTMQLWIHGDQTVATVEFDGNGQYTIDYVDADGTVQHQGGGGVAIAPDGTESPLSEEDLMRELAAPDVLYEDDGTVTVYWYGQQIDITDQFENGVCYVKLVHGAETLYMTVKYENGYATSPHKYISPREFN